MNASQPKTKATLIYSGGSDSYTLLHYLLAGELEVDCLSFDYDQRHRKELAYATAECKRLGLRHHVLPIPFLRFLSTTSALTSKTPVPEGFYAADNMKQTVVPNRNMILLAIGASYAINNGCDVLAYGAHAGDHDIYPDCRADFIVAMAQALAICDWKRLQLYAPFTAQDKRGIYAWGLQHGLDYSRAWTCYKGGDLACGKCGSCVERLHAFHDIGNDDPLQYADREYWKTVVNVKERA